MGYWLFKSEPSSFSLDDLRKCTGGTGHWDGVRNYQARNYLRDLVQPGDGVLFYHSGVKNPAVVGIAEVVRGGYPDFTAFDAAAEHFDPKSIPTRPVWFMVDIRYRQTLPRPVTLSEIRSIPLFARMPLVNRSRLSVQPVTAEEWEGILRLGGLAPQH